MKDPRQQIKISIEPLRKDRLPLEVTPSASHDHLSLVPPKLSEPPTRPPSRNTPEQPHKGSSKESMLINEHPYRAPMEDTRISTAPRQEFPHGHEQQLEEQGELETTTDKVASNIARFNVRNKRLVFGWRNRRRPIKPSKRRVPTAIWATAGLLALALLLPALVVLLRHQPAPLPTPGKSIVVPSPSPSSIAEEEPQVSVYLSKLGQIETLPLEDYVIGVVAAEMPAEFESSALTAQAIAARTFIVQRLLAKDKSGVPIEGADVTDTVAHQAYISKEVLEKGWKNNGKSIELAKLQRAVQDSRNIVMTYKGKPITASFFSTSNGYTENSEDYWKTSIPYLRSVSSPWDKEIAPGYKETLTISKKQFLSDLGLSNIAIPTMKNASSSFNSLIHILSTTEGHRIKELNIGGVIFSGREVREKLGLRSSQFSWADSGNDIVFTTYGYGHGVGMSQWGANGMAKEGYTATQILKHYYTGIDFQQVTKLLAKK